MKQSPKTLETKLSIDGAAELLNVHRSTIERLLESRKLGFYQIGRRRIIGQTHLNDYLAEVERESTSTADRR